MSWKSKYDIEYKGLSEGIHDFDFEVDSKFFEHFEESLIDNCNILVVVLLEKRSSFLNLHFKIKGNVELICDRCLEPYLHKIKHETDVFVKFGETESEEGDNVIWVLPEEHHINIAQLIYEFAVLSIPIRHVHPKKANGERECNKEMIEKLKIYKASSKEDKSKTDPRWDALKNLNNN